MEWSGLDAEKNGNRDGRRGTKDGDMDGWGMENGGWEWHQRMDRRRLDVMLAHAFVNTG